MTGYTPNGSNGPRKIISGDDAREQIEEQLAKHEAGIALPLSRYEAGQAVQTWHRTIRAVEEFINLPLFGIEDEALGEWLASIPIDSQFLSNPARIIMAVRNALAPHFESTIVDRYLGTLVQTAAIANALRAMAVSIDSIGAAVAYYQSRRRHMVSLLYTMPRVCNGLHKLDPLHSLNICLPIIEHSCIAVTSLHNNLALLETYKDFSLEVDSVGARASHQFNALDVGFLEPERASVMAMLEFRRDQIVLPAMEDTNPSQIFSAAELRNNLRALGAAYAAYNLNDGEFIALTQLIERLSHSARDDYFVHVPKPRFKSLLAAQSAFAPATLEGMLVNTAGDYATNTNAYEPFIDIGPLLVSNVTLLSRFVYAFKNIHLGSRRRFQIHAGFIFEDMVKRDLARMGFTVADIKRINRKEFDVVATYGGAIYNLQCKNNWIDLAKIESDRKLYLRYNRTLTSYYERALDKERKREHLLTAKLGLERIYHFVISRFPVMGAGPHVINYNQIEHLQRAL